MSSSTFIKRSTLFALTGFAFAVFLCALNKELYVPALFFFPVHAVGVGFSLRKKLLLPFISATTVWKIVRRLKYDDRYVVAPLFVEGIALALVFTIGWIAGLIRWCVILYNLTVNP